MTREIWSEEGAGYTRLGTSVRQTTHKHTRSGGGFLPDAARHNASPPSCQMPPGTCHTPLQQRRAPPNSLVCSPGAVARRSHRPFVKGFAPCPAATAADGLKGGGGYAGAKEAQGAGEKTRRS